MTQASQYVYILRCSDGTLYTGWTNNLEKRVEAHNSGDGAKYTRGRRPVQLVYSEAYVTKAEAMKCEAAIKKLPRREKLRLAEGIDPRQLEDEKYMRAALQEAGKAAAIGVVPIGCVIICDEKIVGRGYNRRNTSKTTLAHAELIAINQASRRLGDWRLEGCTMYVTLEPCQMCSGALVQSRMDRCVIGAMNPKAGCVGSLLDIPGMPLWNHKVEITRGVLEEECSGMLKLFFKDLRKRVREEKAGHEEL
jgi:tRNA(adenine34) deaminase